MFSTTFLVDRTHLQEKGLIKKTGFLPNYQMIKIFYLTTLQYNFFGSGGGGGGGGVKSGQVGGGQTNKILFSALVNLFSKFLQYFLRLIGCVTG